MTIERTIYIDLDGTMKNRRVEIRNISKKLDCLNKLCYEVVYQYPKDSGSCHYAGQMSYREDDLPQEERDFYNESLNKPEPPKKTSAKEFKNVIQKHYPDCHIRISNNYGTRIKVCLTKVSNGIAETIFEQEGERSEILRALNIKEEL